MMIAKLQSLNSSDPAGVIRLERLPVTVGRGAEADIRLLDRFASRLHCQIHQIEEQLVVQDLGSTWGTMVNGQPVMEAQLHPGDTLTVGLSHYVVEIEPLAANSLVSRFGASTEGLMASTPECSPQLAES